MPFTDIVILFIKEDIMHNINVKVTRSNTGNWQDAAIKVFGNDNLNLTNYINLNFETQCIFPFNCIYLYICFLLALILCNVHDPVIDIQ